MPQPDIFLLLGLARVLSILDCHVLVSICGLIRPIYKMALDRNEDFEYFGKRITTIAHASLSA